MKQLLLILSVLIPGFVFSQIPNINPRNIQLLYQTTGDGIVWRGGANINYTPTSKGNAWMHLDTVNNKLYSYVQGQWSLVKAGGVTDVYMGNDTLYITTSDTVFYTVITPDSLQYNNTTQVLSIRNGNSVTLAMNTDTTLSGNNTLASKLRVNNTYVPLFKDTLTTIATKANVILKLNIQDTTNMLVSYINREDTAAMLANYINVADTSLMLSSYINVADTASMLSNYINVADTSAMLSTYINREDTAAMLSTYVNIADTAAMLNNYVNIADTSAMLVAYINREDTATMLLPYLRKADTLAMLSTYVNFADTASMLSTYVNIADTASMLSTYINVVDTASMLAPYLKEQDTVSVILTAQQKQLAYIKNETGSPLTRGQVVYVSGASGDNKLVSLASSNNESTSSKTFGLVSDATIANGSNGYVITFGLLEGVNTDTFQAGAVLYLHTVSGQITDVKPVAPLHMVVIGFCVRVQQNNGAIFVKTQNGFELDELHDVSVVGLAAGKVLKYNGTVWAPADDNDNQLITLTGDVTGSGTGTFTTTLANSGVAAGTYNNSATTVTPLIIDSKGRITGTGTPVTITPAFSSITSKPTTLSGYGITDAVPSSRTITINGTSFDLSENRSWTINSMVYPGAGIAVSTGSAWGPSIVDNSTNWNTAFTDRLKWDGGSTGLNAATGRTSLGASTVGGNIFTATNPSAISFLRVNADNTINLLSASDFRTAIGASPLAGSTSLTTTGTVTTGTWSGSFGAVSGANLTNLTAGNLTGTIPATVLGNSSLHVGTTQIALNRASANQGLTGISSLAMPGSTSGTVTLQPTATAGTTTITLPATTGTVITSGDNGTVNSTMITDGTIANGDISASAAIAVSKLAASTISGVTLGDNLNTLTLNTSGTGLSGSTTYNGSGAATFTVTSNATNANTASTVVARDGSGNFSAGTITATLSGNATTATTLATGRTIGMTGDVTWTSGSFNGSGNVTGTSTLANSGVTAGTYKSVTVDVKGRVTAGTNPTTLSGYGITDAISTSTIQNENTVLAGPTTGPAQAPTFRTLQAVDIPSLDASKITTGLLPVARGGTGTQTQFNAGSVVFAGADGAYAQDNSRLFWDATNFRLGINKQPESPYSLDVGQDGGNVNAIMRLRSTNTQGSSRIRSQTNEGRTIDVVVDNSGFTGGNLSGDNGNFIRNRTGQISTSNLNLIIGTYDSDPNQDFDIGFFTAENLKAIIKANGDVGIGVASPLSKLHVGGSGTSTGAVLTLANGGEITALNNPLGVINFYSDDATSSLQGIKGRMGVYNEFNGDWDGNAGRIDTYMAFATSLDNTVTEKMRITSDGNVGIGTSTPSSRFHIKQPINDHTGGIKLEKFSGTNTYSMNVDGTNNLNIGYATTSSGAATNLVTVTSAGNVGIGTSSPTYQLSLNRASQAANYQLNINNTGGISDGNFTGIRFSQDDNAGTELGNIKLNYFTVGNTDLSFGTRSGGTVTEKMRITSGGNVGIGEISPSTFKLTVKGDFPVLFNTTSTANSITYGGTRFFRNVNALNNGNGFQFSFNDANNAQQEYGYFGAYIIDNNPSSFDGGLIFSPTFNNTRTEAMRILNTGNVGIGTSSPQGKLHVVAPNQAIILEQQSSSTQIGLFVTTPNQTTTGINSGSFFMTVAGPGSTSTNDGPQFLMRGNNFGSSTERGYLQFAAGNVTSPTGLAGVVDFISQSAFIRFFAGTTEKMRIANNGNVGIGTDSPQNKLDVEGAVAIGAAYSGSNQAPANGLIVEGSVGIGTSSPQKTLHVDGEVRITDLDNGTATRLVGATSDGDIDEITIGSGLTLSSGTLSAASSTPGVTITSSGASVTLTNTSQYRQIYTGSLAGNFTYFLPRSSTLTLGQTFEFKNDSPGTNIEVVTSTVGGGGNSVAVVYPGGALKVVCISTAGNNPITEFDATYEGSELATGRGRLVYDNLSTVYSLDVQNDLTLTASTFQPFQLRRNTSTNGSDVQQLFQFKNSSGNYVIYSAVASELVSNTAGSHTGKLKFYTKGTDNSNPLERLVILEDGNVGIGTTGPQSKLNVNGAVFIGGSSATDANYYLQLNNNSAQKAKANAWDTYSDARIKTQVQPIVNALETINKLNPVTYKQHNSTLINDSLSIDYTNGKQTLGFIAQDVINAVPQAVSQGSDKELWSMDYNKIIPILTKAIQEQQAIIEELKARIIKLENK